MGKECQQILARLELSIEYVKYLTVILEKLESYLEPTQNMLYERYLFQEAEQQPHKTVDLRLRRLAETSDFKDLHDKMLRDRLILGCHDKGTRARMFR